MRKVFLLFAVFCLTKADAAQELVYENISGFWGLENTEFYKSADNDTVNGGANREKRAAKIVDRLNKSCVRHKCKIDPAFPALRWSDGKIFVRKVAENLYKPEHGGMESYQIENNKFRILFNMAPASGKPLIGYWKAVDESYVYYNSNNDAVGKFVPAEGRYYMLCATGDEIVKESVHATLFDGALYFGQNVRFFVDKGFDPVITGFFLFY